MENKEFSEEELEQIAEQAMQDDPRDLSLIMSGYVFEEAVNSIDSIVACLKGMKQLFDSMADMLAASYTDAGWNDSVVKKPKTDELVLCFYAYYDEEDDADEYTYRVGSWHGKEGWELDGEDDRFDDLDVPFWRRLPRAPEMYEEDE